MAQIMATPLAPSMSLICNTSTTKPISLTKSFSFPTPTKLRNLVIKSVRIGGVEIPDNKRVEFSLQHVHGIGRTRSRQILCDLNMDNKITKDLSEEEVASLRDQVSKYMIEGELRRFNALAILRLKEIQCYRGIRHIKGLPCRGQRTRNNCRTLKGKRVPISLKKAPSPIAAKKKGPQVTSAGKKKAPQVVSAARKAAPQVATAGKKKGRPR